MLSLRDSVVTFHNARLVASVLLSAGDGVAGRAWVSDPARWCQRHHRAIARAIASAVRMCRSPGRSLCFQPCRALHCRPWAYSLNCSATADYSSSPGFSPFWSGCIPAARSFGPTLSHFALQWQRLSHLARNIFQHLWQRTFIKCFSSISRAASSVTAAVLARCEPVGWHLLWQWNCNGHGCLSSSTSR